MKKIWITVIGVVGAFVLIASLFIGSIFSTLDREAGLRVTIEAKQKDNKSELDNTIKVISQTAQVTDAQKQALVDIIVGNAKARNGSSGSLATLVKEAVPTVDTTTFNNLQNIIVAKRDGWTMRQKELLDLSREHNKMFETLYSGTLLNFFGRKKIDVVIVTSTRTEQSFETGKDDDISVFNK